MNTEFKQVKELGYSSESTDSLLKICRDRKFVGWEGLKIWNDVSKHNILVSSSFINEIYSRIKALITKSNNRILTITRFLDKMSIILMSEVHLKDHLSLFSFDQQGETDSLEKIKRAAQRENEPILYAMTEFNREYGIFSEKLEDISGRIQKNIVENILQKIGSFEEDNLKKCLRVFPKLKKLLLKKNNKMIEKIKKLNRTFQEKNKSKDRSKKIKSNSFDAANDFVQSVREVDVTMSDMGNIIIEIWKQCIILEEKRLEAIRQAMVKFLDILVEVYGAEAQRTFKNR